jgi:pimeloyl-ACP methyl ester carboxylesterase
MDSSAASRAATHMMPSFIRVNGLELAYLDAGQGPLVVVLHGFPDTAYSFRDLLDRLGLAGFRAVAPFLRGYPPTELPPDRDFGLRALAGDLIGLIDALGAPRAAVVGHDWGSVIAQVAAKLEPCRFDRVVLAGFPHLRSFLSVTPRQLRRSIYMAQFQLPFWPERRLPRDDFAWITDLVRRWSPNWAFEAAELDSIKDSLSRPGRLAAALAYYRAIPRQLVRPSEFRLAVAPLPVPALVIFGSDDGCVGAEIFRRPIGTFAEGSDSREVPGAGHFLHRERPEWFAEQAIDFLTPLL